MTDQINELYWEVVWPEVDDQIVIDHLNAKPFRTPHMLIEWSEDERYGATHHQDWCETKANLLNRRE